MIIVRRRIYGAGGPSLVGYDTPIDVITSTADASSYSGTANGISAGDLVVFYLGGLSASSGTVDPQTWTVNIGSATATWRVSTWSSLSMPNGGFWYWQADTTGNLSLSVTTAPMRSFAARMFLIKNFDTATPIAASGSANSYSSDTTTLLVPNGRTTVKNNNVVLSAFTIKTNTLTSNVVTGADGSVTGITGGGGTSGDTSYALAWTKTPSAGTSVTHTGTWAPTNRAGASWIEINTL